MSEAGSSPGWITALPAEELWEGELLGLRLGESDVLLVNLGDDGIHAYDDRCPHLGSSLSDGTLDGHVLECASHLWQFDAASGSGVNPKGSCLRRFPVRVVDGEIQVKPQ